MLPSRFFRDFDHRQKQNRISSDNVINLLGRQGILRNCSVCQHEPGMHKCCPQCSLTASDEDEIEVYFGFRTINDKSGRYQIPQTWCRDCRGRGWKDKT